MSVEEVREITQQIRELLDAAGLLLAEVKNNKLWKELEYTSFSAYIDGEFGFSRSKAYRIIKAAEINAQVSHARDKLSQRAACELARFPEELQVVIAGTAESYAVSQGQPRTAATIKQVGAVMMQAYQTGGVDTGNGTMSAFGAAVTMEEHERLQRIRQHIDDTYAKKWRTVEKWVSDSAPHVFEMPIEAVGKRAKVIVMVEENETAGSD